MTQRITFLVFPRYELLDLSGPASAFHLANEMHGAPYRLRIASADGGAVIDRAGFSIDTEPFTAIEKTETLIAVGGPTAHENTAGTTLVDRLAELAPGVRRLASVCTGTFLLAAAGLLANRRVTTHWRYAGMLQAQHPDARVDADKIFIRDGNIWTSAGMSAGIDLALGLIEEDFGADLAKAVARDMVVYFKRPGGQSQFSALVELAPHNERMQNVLQFARNHLREDLSVERLAGVACLSARQFSRAFLHATGETPAKAVERLRLEVAKARIEDEDTPLDQIARDAGFGDVERMRRSCKAAFSRTPQELRRLARQPERQIVDLGAPCRAGDAALSLPRNNLK